ncbi:MAG: hypothetical protein ACLU5J_03385 [Christensenellales bacterium]
MLVLVLIKGVRSDIGLKSDISFEEEMDFTIKILPQKKVSLIVKGKAINQVEQ